MLSTLIPVVAILFGMPALGAGLVYVWLWYEKKKAPTLNYRRHPRPDLERPSISTAGRAR